MVVLLVGALVQPLGVAAPPAGAAAGADGLLLTQDEFVEADGSTFSTGVLAGAFEFSPDGAAFAGSVGGGSDDESVAFVRYSSGREVRLATLPGLIKDISWSGDARNLAVVTEDGLDSKLYRVPVSGGPATLLVADDDTLDLDTDSTSFVTWDPTGDDIAFVASVRGPFGGSSPGDSRQVFVVPAAGGQPSRFNSPFRDPGCEGDGPSCTSYTFADIDWSPDGTKIAALVERNVDGASSTSEQSLATITRGQQVPTTVRSNSSFTDPDGFYSHAGSGPVTWSTDGARIQLRLTRPDDAVVPTIVDAASGAVVGTHPWRSDYRDRQPCPTGTCAPWRTPAGQPQPQPPTPSTPGSADLVSTVSGFADDDRVGDNEPVTASVTNAGPDAAANATIRIATPAGSAYGWVRRPVGAWTCDISSKAYVSCTTPSLAAGATATLSVGVWSGTRRKEAVLTSTVTSTTGDPARGNNTAVQGHAIKKDKVPAPPSSNGRIGNRSTTARRSSPWKQVSSDPQLWIRVTDVSYVDPIDNLDVVGSYSATMWGFEGGSSRVVRMKFQNRLTNDSIGLHWDDLYNEAACKVADTAANSYCSYPRLWRIRADDEDSFMRGTWTFVRNGLSKNKKFSFKINR